MFPTLPIDRVPAIRLMALFLLGGGFAQGSYTFTTIDDPSAQFYPQTFAVGVNNTNVIAGYYSTSEYNYTGFTDSGGTFSSVSNTNPTTKNTYIYGINDSGTTVGMYQNLFDTYGFVDNGGTFSNISVPGTFDTYAMGINDSGLIIGYSYNGTTYNGFLDNNGTFTSINDPNAGASYGQGTFATGINSSGVVVGYYLDSTGTAHGFIDQNGIFTTINDPGAGQGTNEGTYAWGLNDSGEISGYYVVEGTGQDLGLDYHGFVLNGSSFTTIDDPDALATGGTQVYGINDVGDLVGQFTCSTCGDNYQGFFAAPEQAAGAPEPSTFPLLLAGMVMLILLHRAHGYKQPRG